MKPVVLDASVWVAALDPRDSAQTDCRALLRQVAGQKANVYGPAFARVEVACALSRKLRDAAKARDLADQGFLAASVQWVPMDGPFLEAATEAGTRRWLRGADALYAEATFRTGSVLVSLDQEHLSRAEAITPSEWLRRGG